jgi:hypothetical protein
LGNNFPNGIFERSNVANAVRHRLNAHFIQSQPIDHRWRKLIADRLFHVPAVLLKDCSGAGTQPIGHGTQAGVPGFTARSGQNTCSRARASSTTQNFIF